jgi:L-fuconolactonase
MRAVRVDLAEGLPDELAGLARRNLTLDLKLRPEHLPLLPRLAERAPLLRMVIDDLASPSFGAWSEAWARDMEVASRLPQVFCKASGLAAGSRTPWNAAEIRPYVQFALRVFGPRRVMFGSGWPACLPASTWKETLAAFTQSIGAQPLETRELLLGENARRVYGLDRGVAAHAW